jgi:signal transduction histidine kinase
MARSMVELHQGRIWVESVEGNGSRFTFVLLAYPEAVELIPIE